MFPIVRKPASSTAGRRSAALGDRLRSDPAIDDRRYGLCPAAAGPQKKVVGAQKKLDNRREWPINKNEKDDQRAGNQRERPVKQG